MTEFTKDELIALIKAGLDDAERKARRAIDGERSEFVDADDDIVPLLYGDAGKFDLPTRVLQDVEAKRAIVALCETETPETGGLPLALRTLRLLAALYERG